MRRAPNRSPTRAGADGAGHGASPAELGDEQIAAEKLAERGRGAWGGLALVGRVGENNN